MAQVSAIAKVQKSSEQGVLLKKRRKRKFTQSFREEWLNDQEFAGWLQPDLNDKSSSYCTCCNVTLRHADRTMLMAHKKTTKHKNFVAGIVVPENPKKKQKQMADMENFAKAELYLACFFVEHQLPYQLAEKLSIVCRSAFKDTKIARKFNLTKKKLAYLIQDGIAYHEKEEIGKICSTQKFSVLIDENIDVVNSSFTPVVVRFFDTQKLDLVDVLFDTISPDNTSNDEIYNSIKMLFVNKSIPMENIVGFGGDNCLNGIFSLLKSEVPTVFGVGCDSHTFSLCFNRAVAMLPRHIETFLHDIASYFINNGQMLTDFGVDVDIVRSVQNKVQELSSVTWLSYENIINAVLGQWNVLTQFFHSFIHVDTTEFFQVMHTTITQKGTKHMLLFLQYILEKVNSFTLDYQADEFRIHVLHSLISQSYRAILSCFVKDTVMLKKKLSVINPADTSVHKSLDDIFLGGKAMALMYQEPLEEENENFLTSCLQFLIALSKEIKANFPVQEDGHMAQLSVLDPAVAQDCKRSPCSILKLADNFPNFVPDEKVKELDLQWRHFRSSKEFIPPPSSIPRFWYLLRHVKDSAGKPKYDILSEFMTNLSVLPHTSAAVEKIFSQVNLIKAKYPNLLKSEAVKDQFIARQMLSRKNATCRTWEPSRALLEDRISGACLKRFEMRLEIFQAISGNDDIKVEELVIN